MTQIGIFDGLGGKKAQFLFKNPEYKVLFDASRKVRKEDVEFVKQTIDRMRWNTDDGEC